MKHLEEISEDEMEENRGDEVRRLRLALDGKINELKKFKEGYSNSKREHEKEKKRLHHRIEELEKSSQQGKKEDRIEELEDLKKKNEELSRWVDYVEDDLDSIIFKMEKIEDDMNMKIGSTTDLKEETENLVKLMKTTLRKYCVSTSTEDKSGVEDEPSLQEVKEEMEDIKDQLRDTRSGSQKYQNLTNKLGILEKKISPLDSEEGCQKNEVLKGDTNTQGALWKFGDEWYGTEW